MPIKTAWFPWYTQGEVRLEGMLLNIKTLTFVTVRGVGHFVPSNQPARALVLFSSFLDGNFHHLSEGSAIERMINVVVFF